jgi:hypothetical protein
LVFLIKPKKEQTMANQDTFRGVGSEGRNRSNLGGMGQKTGQTSSMKDMAGEGFEQISSRLGNINLGWKSVLSTLGVLGAIGAFSAFGVQKYRRSGSSAGGRRSGDRSAAGMKDIASNLKRGAAGFKGGKSSKGNKRSH